MARRFKIQIKRIYETPVAADGYRVLVDGLWPRGIKKYEARLDEWNKALAPSPALRKWFGHKPERFEEFARRYEAELMQQQDELMRVKNISKAKTITLLYGAKDPEINQAIILSALLSRI